MEDFQKGGARALFGARSWSMVIHDLGKPKVPEAV
jgi:hypothetical protein